MCAAPHEITLEIRATARFDVIDVTQQLASDLEDFLAQYRRSLYCSYHTTAGYLEQSLCARLNNNRERLDSFLRLFRHLFPPDANYEHDKLHLRHELSDEQRRTEPKNADSHLAFIGGGLKNCVTYVNHSPDTPVYFIDLDGVSEHGVRTRRTTVMGYNREELIGELEFPVSVSSHPIDSINLRDEHIGLFDRLGELVRTHGVTKGRIDISLDTSESQAGLSVNEYETLLMRNDLVDVLKNPVQFMAQHGRDALRNPLTIPGKTLNYAQYDLVQVLNELMDKTRMSESFLERVLAKAMALPASRFLRMKRSVSLLVTDRDGNGEGSIVQGTYQSPILIQWSKAEGQTRRLKIQLRQFS